MGRVALAPGHAFVLLAAMACEGQRAAADGAGDGTVPPPFDAGPPDAGLPPCLRPIAPGEGFGDWLLRDCGICLEAHARYVNPYGVGPGGDTEAIGVPGGVVILFSQYDGARTVFVSEEGEVIPNEDTALVPEPDGTLSTRMTRLTGAPDVGRVWVTSHLRRPFQPGVGATHAVLFEVTPDGLRRAAGGRVNIYLHPIFSTREGILIADAVLDGRKALLRLRPTADGGVDERRVPVMALDLPDVLYGNMTMGWGLSDGNAAFVWNVNDGRTRTDYLVVVTPDLELARPVETLTVDRWLYEDRAEPVVYSSSQRRDGSIVLALAGALAGMDAADSSHYWLLRVNSDGTLRNGPPGVWLNPDLFIARADAHTYWQMSNPILFPDEHIGLIWQFNHINFGMVYDLAQIIDADGSRRFTPPHSFGEITAYSWPRWVFDGADRPYLGRAEFRYPDTSLDHAYSVATIDEGFVEPWHVYVQGCEERTGEANITTAGAWEEGVWVIWADELRDMNGHRHLVTKATLIRSDGSFAWGE